MKKMLTLVLVLAVASLANAAINLQISVGGSTGVVETTVSPSTNITLGIVQTGNFEQSTDPGSFGIIVKSGPATISGGVVMTVAPSASMIDTDPANQADLAAMFGGPGIFGGFASWTAGTFAGGLYIDDLTFHCDGPGDVLVDLVWTTDFQTYTTVDSWTVHQVVPEPITMSLLGLGGLFLRRRK
jgi:hypothetical protein